MTEVFISTPISAQLRQNQLIIFMINPAMYFNTQGNILYKMSDDNDLKNFTTLQFLNFALGFFGIQFAWQLEIILAGPVTESLGAPPFIFGLIWLAGPITGVIVQPLIGAISDKTYTKFGRRRIYLLTGALLGSLALWIFPNSGVIINYVNNIFSLNLPHRVALLFAALMIWIIDASLNISQGPYRALIPDIVPDEQHSIANSYISLAIGTGSVMAAGIAPFLKWAFDYNMTISARFLTGSIVLLLTMIWTCLMIKEPVQKVNLKNDDKQLNFFKNIYDFFNLSPEVKKICIMQFFSWVGTMCMVIFFTQYSVHTVFNVPDLANATQDIKNALENLLISGTNFSSICFVVFNLVCFIFAVPIGFLSLKFGKKKIHQIALSLMLIAFLTMTFFHSRNIVLFSMALAGIGWASLLALPFAMLSRYIKKGAEGLYMGIFNIFIAGSQIFTCTLIAWSVSKTSFHYSLGTNYHWEYVFLIGAFCLFFAILTLSTIKERL